MSDSTTMQLFHTVYSLSNPMSESTTMQLFHTVENLSNPMSDSTTMQLFHTVYSLSNPMSESTTMQLFHTVHSLLASIFVMGTIATMSLYFPQTDFIITQINVLVISLCSLP